MTRVLRPVALLLMALGSATITAASAVYFDAQELPPFVIEKLPLAREDLYLLALKVHVVSAAFALPACALLLWNGLLRRAPRVHRWLGRVTGIAVLLALAPSGFYLSAFAKGGVLGTLGFALSGAIVVVSMVQAVRSARGRRFAAHRRHSLHVLAQLSVAVTSRAMLLGLDALAVDPDAAYLASLWLPVIGSAALVEALAPRPFRSPFTRRNHAPLAHARQPAHDHPGLRDAARG
jgi:uncharacterized membrane protein